MLALDASQEDALQLALHEPICIITGGPGTGKTTIIKELLARMTGKLVGLCAPTGKAAKRMQEATSQEAKTIHRLLAYNPVDGFWFGNSELLPYDVIVVDEVSMVDTELLSHLLKAIDERRTRLVLVGDFNQLPSVGPGAILYDLVRSALIPVAILTQVHRSKEGSWICNNAPRILDGQELLLVKRDGFRFVEVESAGNVPKFCGDLYDLDNALQILSPQSTGHAGTTALNTEMQRRFNPSHPDAHVWKTGKEGELRRADKVIHTINDYELGIFNGECGVIEHIGAKRLLVQYPDKQYPVEYTREQARALKLAYALTIHKSQGSEWAWVIVIVHSTHTFMLTRQLLYTAVTRGKEGVIIVGNRKGIENALKCKRDSKRNTALCDRIRGEL